MDRRDDGAVVGEGEFVMPQFNDVFAGRQTTAARGPLFQWNDPPPLPRTSRADRERRRRALVLRNRRQKVEAEQPAEPPPAA